MISKPSRAGAENHQNFITLKIQNFSTKIKNKNLAFKNPRVDPDPKSAQILIF